MNYPHQSGSPDFDGAEAFEAYLDEQVPRRCDNCLHMRQETVHSHDAPPESEAVCGFHIVAGGWRRMRVDPESVCSDHEFDDLSDRKPTEPQYPSSDWPRF